LKPLEALHEAGIIASKVRDKVADQVKPGAKLFDLCILADSLIDEMGGKPAFPINIDINQVAAHYTSALGDQKVVPEGSLVKLDIGVHIDGYVADTATTVCLDPFLQNLVDAVEDGLNSAINTMKAGVRVSEVGSVIEKAIRLRGVKPVRNLTGHKMSRYVLHSGKSIPNISGVGNHRLEVGEVYAVEPFSVPLNADGVVHDGAPSNIYRFVKKRNISSSAKEVLNFVQKEYKTLPFASRWFLSRFPDGRDSFIELLNKKCLMSYPQLIERSRAIVAQAEHTVIVRRDGCEVTTV
jgi:methionyl aminopeptidase